MTLRVVVFATARPGLPLRSAPMNHDRAGPARQRVRIEPAYQFLFVFLFFWTGALPAKAAGLAGIPTGTQAQTPYKKGA